MKEPADFGNEDRFIGKKGDRVERIDFNDIWIVIMETAVKIE